jgi:DNA-binding NarL/FixJ family response regulator
MEKISVLIADDHKLIRETWSFILNNDPRFTVVAECGDSEQAVEMAKNKKPQIVLMDINMLPISGFAHHWHFHALPAGLRQKDVTDWRPGLCYQKLI